MRVCILCVPYDLGRDRVGMGLGPQRLLEGGLADDLRHAGHTVEVREVQRQQQFANEIGASFDVNRVLAGQVRQATAEGSFPLVLAGNCNSALGTIAGVGPADLGLVWFDAHGEFNTPDTTRSGFLDGMPLSILTGRCWKAMAARIPGFAPIADDRILLVGARELDHDERTMLDRAGIALVPPAQVQSGGAGGFADALAAMVRRVRRAYLHLDLDVLDPADATANAYASPGGIRLADLRTAIGIVADHFDIAAAAVASYDPASDPNGVAAAVARGLVVELLDAVAGRGSQGIVARNPK